ncbi:MAG: hypothetical protein AABZ94_02410 [Candidatus Eisenbacteria bacterium]
MTDLPSRLPWRAAILWALLALAIATVHASVTVRQISPSSDLWDYAQQARQIARGEGFTSLYTYPTLLGAEEKPPYPVRWRMPLFSWRGAMMLQSGMSLPEGYFILAAFSQALLVGLVLLLGAHFHSARAGAIAAAAAIACPLLLDSFNPGLSQVPVAAFGLLVWLLLLRGRGLATALVAAVVAAAIWYARAESLLFAPLWIAAAWQGARRVGAGGPAAKAAPAHPLARSLAFALALVALCAPWPFLLRAMSGDAAPIQGNPMLLYTSQFPGYASSRTYLEPMPGYMAYVLGHPATFALRWVKDVVGFLVEFGAGLGPIAIGLAMAGLLLREPKGRFRDLAPTRLFFLAIALQIAAFAALQRSPRFLVPVVPLACVAIGIAAAPALDRFCGRRTVAFLFLLLIGERAATVGFETRSAARRFPSLPVALAAALRERAPAWPRDQLLLTDVPDWSAWHLDRPALLLPTSRSMARVMEDHPVAAILLSPAARARNVADGDSVWIEIWDRVEPLAGFRGPIPLPGGARIYEREDPRVAPRD